MNENIEEEITIKNRILLRETTIRKLTSKYLEFINKINSLTRSEMSSMIKDILNEIDLIEIGILKAQNYENLKDIDNNYFQSLSSEIENKVKEVSKEIVKCEDELIVAKKEKEYKIHCEEIATVINSYSSKKTLEDQIAKLERENTKNINTQNMIMSKLNGKSKKLSLLVKLIDDLKEEITGDIEDINSTKMVID